MGKRHDLPAIKSFFDPGALGQAISQAYSLSSVRCQLIKAALRDVYHVMSDEGDLVALVLRTGCSQEAIEEEIALMAYLATHGLPVVAALQQTDGEYLLTLSGPEGIRYAYVLPFVSGAIRRDPELRIVRDYGTLLAEFHDLTDKLPEPHARPIYDAETLLVQPIKTLASIIGPLQTRHEELGEIAGKLYPMLETLPKDKPGFGMVHGDVIPSNALITSGGQLTLIDFDLFGLGWRTYDIASYLNEIGYWQMGEPAATAFLDGYNSVRPLSAGEARTLPLMRIARHIFGLHVAASHVNTWGSSASLSDRVVDATIRNMRELGTHIGMQF